MSKTRIVLSSNSKLVGEAANSRNAQFPWKWQRNSSISLPFSYFFLLFAFLPPLLFWLYFPLRFPVETRAMRRMRSNIHSDRPASVPRFFRSLDKFSFARLPCVVLSTKKAQSCDNFQVENRTFYVCVFIEETVVFQVVHTNTHTVH